MARYGGSWESDQDEYRVAGDGHAYAELGHQELRCPGVGHAGFVLDVAFANVRELGVANIWFEGVRYEGDPLEDIGSLGREDVRNDDRDPAEGAGGTRRHGQRGRGRRSGPGAEPAHENDAHPDARHSLCR